MDMVCDLTLLLATLSIMTAALVITGVPTKLGALLIAAAGVNLAAMVLMAFIFGCILGTGLPPAPTYILVAIVIAPPMIQAGVNPWVVHFFAFFLACFGELTPPTSLVAAVTAKIANANVLFGAQSGAADLHFPVHADGGRLRSSGIGHRARPRTRSAPLSWSASPPSACRSACRPGSPMYDWWTGPFAW